MVEPEHGSWLVRSIFLGLAGISLALALLGVFLPLLPTTPFVLLGSACLVRSSPRLQLALRQSPLFGPLLRDWERHHGIRMHVKISAIATVVLVIGASLWFGSLNLALRILLLALAAIGIAVVLRLRTVRD